MKKIMFNDRYGLTKAVLEGKKTMTRRLCNFKVPDEEIGKILNHSPEYLISKNPYKVGEIVAVAQRYQDIFDYSNCVNPYAWEDDYKPSGWTNKMFTKAELMPHKIRITSIRAERLQNISDEECLREGVGVSATDNLVGFPIAIPFNYYIGRDEKGYRYVTPREAFSVLIDKVSGRGTWQSNPYVWVYEFELLN